MPYAFEAVLFDMDGVVIDNAGLHMEVWREFITAHGVTPSAAEIQGTNGRRALDVVRTFFGDTANDEELHRLAEAREALYGRRLTEATVQAVPGIAEYLQGLARHGVPRILATSATPENVARVLDRLGLRQAFDGMVTAQDVRNGKPDPEVYLAAAKRAGVDPARCLVVEDALPGIQAGLAAGCACLGIATSLSPEDLAAAGATWTATSFHQLPENLRPEG